MNRILVLEDDKNLQMLYREELEEDGYEVYLVADGLQLTDVIKKVGPDIVILDIRLGRYDGLDILQRIRKEFYELPVILHTAYSAFKSDPRSIAVDYYLVKSWDLSELKAKIRKTIEGAGHIPHQRAYSNSYAATKNLPQHGL
jgi:DNA-binding response OmpR family regulator